ncbi:SRPBCC family protein [Sphingopyxis sp. RIFCSPHIGHO2_12_FULL_65_19]|uniref:hypothetical protein n=1 Tax=Sphingopyxis sp. RIFCSPHIGHO2_12_FULL_65_19 TaxID=1802172 RepID=UPI0008AF03B3|nr:hypothetical protein [Sphingopyxis sp. RIFCSPHIGHO2_12_FULL_65_19]OHD07212.1 MAG: hypothetical protein A3E77_06780 [Sphingopyxis sp. RIFCSPHIGHO2_12_FULL_65_19]
MTISGYLAGAAIVGALAFSQVAAAKVVDQGDTGFTVAHTAQVAASPADVWKMLRMPESWWSKEHSWSGDAANFWLDSQAGGCFCEKLPDTGAGVGSVQHARVLFSKPGQLLRLSGAFGPLQGEALSGTLTIQIKETPTGSALRFDYVVGGYTRFKVADIAPAVDKVIGEQLLGLAAALGGALPPTRDEKAASEGADKAKADAPAATDEPGLDAAVADLVDEEAKSAPEER